tara:strand:- start:1647 stop:1826 length:180 start_codon:yes stop_codon:yes gene_type:complete
MIDTDKYEEMTWQTPANVYAFAVEELLAEVKRLREIIGNREWTIKLCDEEIKRLKELIE